MNATVKRIDGQYRLVSETMQILDHRSWKTANGAKRYATRNGYTLINTPMILNAAILTRAAGKLSYALIVNDSTYLFHSRNAAIQYCKTRFCLPIMDYTMNH